MAREQQGGGGKAASTVTPDNINTLMAVLWHRVKIYMTTEEEGGGQSLRCLAFVTKEESGERDGGGHLVLDAFILRPEEAGGAFGKANIPFTKGRDPGTLDNLQAEDNRLL